MIGTAHRARHAALGGLIAIGAAGLAAGQAPDNGGLPEGRERVNLDPADFTTRIDNPYYPLRPGDRPYVRR